jgi:hypothetical protein
VKVSTYATSSGGGNISSGASAVFTDALILNRDGLYGESGTISIKYYVDFNQSYLASGDDLSNGQVSFDGLLGATHGYVTEYDRDGYGDTPPIYKSTDSRGVITTRPGGPSWIYITSDFRWGFPLGFGLGVQLDASAYSPSSNAALAYSLDAAHSGYWGGITEVMVNGVKVEDYELTSLSGTDYSKSFAPTTPTADIPEPSSFALFTVAGLIAFCTNRRRRRG